MAVSTSASFTALSSTISTALTSASFTTLSSAVSSALAFFPVFVPAFFPVFVPAFLRLWFWVSLLFYELVPHGPSDLGTYLILDS